jgi:probable aminopeptidase NPEPL1
VLGDATKHSLIDMATLTGAQAIATGKKHASISANTFELEQRAANAGLRSGDLCFPISYTPELLVAGFDQKMADMKNSVARTERWPSWQKRPTLHHSPL